MLKFYCNSSYNKEQLIILQEIIEESINMALVYSENHKVTRVLDDLTRLNRYLIKRIEDVENSVESVENKTRRKRKQLKKYLENQNP